MTETLELPYDLSSLPTAQHRAGLAGLVVLAEAWRKRALAEKRDRTEIVEIQWEGPCAVKIPLTQISLTALLDYLYDAAWQLRSEPNLRKDKKTRAVVPPEKTEVVRVPDADNGTEREETRHYYRVMVPSGRFLADLEIPEPWLRLWREIVWSAIRAIPTTRRPYEDRASERSVGGAGRIWQELQDDQHPIEVAGTIYLGAQSHTADLVPFQGLPAQTLLLHFWQVVMGVGEARTLTIKQAQVKDEKDGYVIALPDVIDLEGFCMEYPDAVAQLGTDMAGYRPRDAVLAVPAEGALEYQHRISSITQTKTQRGKQWTTMAAVEVYHLRTKPSRPTELASVTTLPMEEGRLNAYEKIRGLYRSMVFRRGLIENVLAGNPWYTGFASVLDSLPRELFLGEKGKDFSRDLALKFKTELATGAEAADDNGKSDDL